MHQGENGLGFVDVNRENELKIDGNAYKNDEVSFVANARNKVPTTIFAWAIIFVDYHECHPVFFSMHLINHFPMNYIDRLSARRLRYDVNIAVKRSGAKQNDSTISMHVSKIRTIFRVEVDISFEEQYRGYGKRVPKLTNKSFEWASFICSSKSKLEIMDES